MHFKVVLIQPPFSNSVATPVTAIAAWKASPQAIPIAVQQPDFRPEARAVLVSSSMSGPGLNWPSAMTPTNTNHSPVQPGISRNCLEG